VVKPIFFDQKASGAIQIVAMEKMGIGSSDGAQPDLAC